ncbi:MAG: transporter substrate-binding domain-containing protein [Oceanospirillaceae bacterium]|nr:transporter substrate-binding domain-containing protein [Oceanospirillaceae bacterium]
MATLMLLLSSLCSASQAGQVLRVGLPTPGQVPYLWQEPNGEVRGIYADTLRAIATDLQLQLEFIELSQARLIRLFIAGEIDIEVGVSTRRQGTSQLEKLSIFSRPFGIVNEVIIYNPKLEFPAFILKDLKGRSVATVRGTVVPDYIQRQNFASELQIATRVHRGWSQVGLMREASAVHYKTRSGKQYKISLPYESNSISLRLRQDQTELRKRIDLSIGRLAAAGELENIICKYLCAD